MFIGYIIGFAVYGILFAVPSVYVALMKRKTRRIARDLVADMKESGYYDDALIARINRIAEKKV